MSTSECEYESCYLIIGLSFSNKENKLKKSHQVLNALKIVLDMKHLTQQGS